MSRIGKKPVPVPAGVTVEIGSDNFILVKGPKGELSQKIHPDMKLRMEDDLVKVERPTENGYHRALHGLSRTLVQNMVTGVSAGFEKTLEIQGVGYRAIQKGADVEIQAGYSHPVLVQAPPGVQIEVSNPTKVYVRGADKQRVGEVAAGIRAIRPPEPYKGKGIRYGGEHVRRKVGKTGK